MTPPPTDADMDRMIMLCYFSDRPDMQRLVNEVRRVRRLCASLAARVAAQSELLGKRAERTERVSEST